MVITTVFGNFLISTISSNGHFSSASISKTKNFGFCETSCFSNSAYNVLATGQPVSQFVGSVACRPCKAAAFNTTIVMKRVRLTYSDTHVLRYLQSPTEKLGASRDETPEHCTGTGCLDYSHDWIITYSHTTENRSRISSENCYSIPASEQGFVLIVCTVCTR
jgi:hypothetical protein